MNAPLARRNDPCPCGSGRRFKECHGKLAADTQAPRPPANVEEAFRSGMEAFRRRDPDAAIAMFDAVLAAEPGNAFAMHFKGYALCQKGQFEVGIPLLDRSLAMQPRNPDFNGNFGAIRYVLGELPEAIRLLENAIALAPEVPEPHSNLALALRDSGEFERALGEARRALELRADFPAARINFAVILLALGRFAEAWPAYVWRPDPAVNLRDPLLPNRHAHATRLPPLDKDPWLTLHGEQGLGDMLFFLRFAPLLRARGARLRFWGDARLATMLVRSGVVDEASAAEPAAVTSERLLWLGDLPALLGVGDSKPLPIALVPEAARVESMSAKLRALGPAPYVALTWRAGLPRRGKAVLAKEIAPQAFGRALAGVRATFVSVQRAPQPEEHAKLSAALGVPVHDLSAANDDLEDMLALMSVVDEYVGVSNTNIHLRAAVGKPARVLVAFPPEWRWLSAGDSSPWFPEFPLYRAAPQGDWSEALARLARDMSGSR